MHREILTEIQSNLLPTVKLFSKKFGLVGGTAIALHLGHRESLDFDLFSFNGFNNYSIRAKITEKVAIDAVLVNKKGEYTFLIGGVKFTFFQFPYKINFSESLDDIIKLPDILTLAAMKAFALGRRAKWKDYVDLYFILKGSRTVSEITIKGVEIFGNEFNEKIFRTQLAYFEDIDYSEEIIYKKGFSIADEIIRKALIEFSLEG
ncbi:nucleotidyl transferase AbiEii/AbiGii toxin family protein [Patescibacteria group bacterium]|nr:nucleotidyl transferase AbiEii/AbiGii toxin family protein [Patescibacteria group bacterium]MBU4016030.1 nucleotidyl transferase AbiEii/AbiGii toxin family protein [Patescibacteria group bacterium]MBU4098181.1 nucleotidyl transferase AbiEii/AbiGii toxin family protein [Patescibacteria group bacterium]